MASLIVCRNNTFLCFCLILSVRKQLKLGGPAYLRLKSNREENLTKYAESTDASVKKVEKIGRANDEK